MTANRNAFEAMCEIATRENWCWNLQCTTCGQMYFRHGLKELADGKHPDEPGWTTSEANHEQLGAFRRQLSIDEQRSLSAILADVSIANIAAAAKFPDWLGFLGVALARTVDAEKESGRLTRAWAPQLAAFVEPRSEVHSWLMQLGADPAERLMWQSLGSVEHEAAWWMRQSRENRTRP